MSPLTFRCGKCRAVGLSWEATGRSREQRTHFGAATAYEYRCRCKHTGWTIHPAVRLQFKIHEEAAR